MFARSKGITTDVLDHNGFATREAFDEALATRIDGVAQPGEATLVVLAGFMRILTPVFVSRYAGRLVNIHPSLLPAFPGLHTHQRAIDAGCKFAGATVHLVTAELDHGPILAQAVVPVLPGDTADALAARVLTLEIAERAGKRMVFVVNGAAQRARITGEAAIALSQHGTVAPEHLIYPRGIADLLQKV